MNILEKLLAIQTELKCEKTRYNTQKDYYYRSLEDILTVVKPLTEKYNAVLVLTDGVNQVGERYYIEATARLIDIETQKLSEIKAVASVREGDYDRRLDGAQLSGSCSSYARKMALGGLFNIDDSKDGDFLNDIDYREEFRTVCKERGIKEIEYAKEHGINKETTQLEYKRIVEELKK